MRNGVEAIDKHRLSRVVPMPRAENDNRSEPGRTRRSRPMFAWRLAKEAIQLLWVCFDVSVIALACLLVAGAVTPTSAFVTLLAAAVFVTVKALSGGYAR